MHPGKDGDNLFLAPATPQFWVVFQRQLGISQASEGMGCLNP
jgi:hypothetical protein